MAFGDQIQKRADIIRKRGANVSIALAHASRVATRAAIDAAVEKTPPMGEIRGTGTVTGDLRQHWETDSQAEPEIIEAIDSTAFATHLANSMQYVSYVNNGHRMDKHFVPGLIVNPFNGMLERSPDGSGGIVVGTKTQYVPGAFMREAGIEAFEDTANKELLKIAKEALRD